MQYCSDCGAAIYKDAVFCTNCGTKLDFATEKEPTFDEAVEAMRQVMAYTTKKVEDTIKTIDEKIEQDARLKEARETMRQVMMYATKKVDVAIETIETTMQKALEGLGEKKCTQCGITLPNAAIYCWRCGAAVQHQ